MQEFRGRHTRARFAVLLAAFGILCVSDSAEVFAADPDVPDLTQDETRALQSITRSRILGTVSFLASDELAGRDTPSRELTIATSYVAARFREAGLEPLGDDDSYYQVHSLDTLQLPREPAWLLTDSRPVPQRLAVLSAFEDPLELKGTVLSEDDALSTDTATMAVVDDIKLPPRAASRPASALAFCTRRVRRLAAKGIKVVFLRCAADSQLYDAVESLQRIPIRYSSAVDSGCAVVLIGDGQEIAGEQVKILLPSAERKPFPVRNVAGILRGRSAEHAQEAIIISAHLDHIGVRAEGADTINNGADDNATGVTTVLALADAFAALTEPAERSVIFMTFWGEEKGLLGSREFVKQPLWPLDKITANINIEMVGRPETDAIGKAWMTGWSHSNLGQVMNAGSQRAGVEIFNRTDVGEMLYTRSDNYPFAEKGVIAHSFSAGSLHSDYHQPTDEWEKLDLDHMTKVVRGLFAGSLVAANNQLKIVREQR